ncbi:hypothetical protein CSC18_1587 [Klebsiella aerogenes]|nr:hypothetical protein CSC18_1587 [Klebsiella aerogenes]
MSLCFAHAISLIQSYCSFYTKVDMINITILSQENLTN